MSELLFEKNVLIAGQIEALGSDLAREVLRHSGRVIMISPNGEHKALLPESANKDNSQFYKSSLGKLDPVRNQLQKAKAKFGHLHHALILVGGPVVDGALLQDAERWESCFAQWNLEARNLAMAAMGRMLETGGGVVTFVINANGGPGILRDSALQATEAACLSLMNSLAAQYTMNFMRANAVVLGPLDGHWPGDESQLADQRKALRELRLLRPSEVAASTVEWISSPTKFSGQILRIGD